MYSKEQVVEATLAYFKGDSLATNVWVDKYCLKDNKKNYYELTPEDMHRRIAKELARIEGKYPNPISEQDIFELLDRFRYLIPQGSPMEGIGNGNKFSTLSNCYVIPSPKDSYGGILTTERRMVEIYKRRGGVGLSIHSLRAKDMPTSSVSEKSSGLVLFGERYSNATREVAQDGRRGALMLSCRVDHPDIEDFIDAKVEKGKITGANISVMISDKFMEAVKNNEPFELNFTGNTGSFSKTVDAKKIWDKIIKNAWKHAEPGVLFWDTILKESPAGCYGDSWKEVSTNPCSELPLCEYDSCRLMAINLFSYVENPFHDNASFNYEKLAKHVSIFQRLMDDLIDLEIEKIDRILEKLVNDPDKDDDKSVEIDLWTRVREKAYQGRRTGLGITALGDTLAALGFRYGTVEATQEAVKIQKLISLESYISSINMAEERGAFPIWDVNREDGNPFIDRVFYEFLENKKMDYIMYGRRNIANLTIAPTGSVSILTQTTSGIEPLFSPFYIRRRKTNDSKKISFKDDVGDTWEEYRVFHHKFIDWATVYYNTKLASNDVLGREEIEHLLMALTQSELDEVIGQSPYYKATANDVNWIEKVRMQGGMQKWVDHSISVTVNVPKSTTIDTVDKIYLTAWEEGCKGCTIYRDGSRDGVLLNISKKEEEGIIYKEAPKRESALECDIFYKTALGKDWMVIVGLLKGKPYEIFAFDQLPHTLFPREIKKGVITRVRSRNYQLVGEREGKQYSIENIIDLLNEDEKTETRRYSLDLRYGIHPKDIVTQIDKYANVSSFDKAISRVLKTYIDNETMGECDICGGKIIMQDGCEKCESCGWSKCG